MLKPYSDRPTTTGTLIYNASDLLAGVKKWKAAGYQVAAHAIGDAANRQVLDVYEQADAKAVDRFRVEHVQILSEPDLPRFFKLGVIPSMQTTHCASDLGYADARLGARANLSYAWRALLDSDVENDSQDLLGRFGTPSTFEDLETHFRASPKRNLIWLRQRSWTTSC